MVELEEIRSLTRLQTLHAQMEALQADLQVTKGLIQAGRNGGGGETTSPIPRFMRLDVPMFLGADPDWDATEWFRWMKHNKMITTWDGFLESVQNRFGPCKYEDPQGALSKLLQKGTVTQYQSEFEKLMNRVTDVFEGLLISFYISGLKPVIQRELLVSKPTSLGDAFSFARVTEVRLDNQVRGHKCPRKFLLLVSDDEDDMVQESKEDEVESDDISILNSLIGQGSPRSLQLWGTIGLGIVHGPNVVLGIQWLQKFRKVTLDYAQQTREFSLSNTTYSLKGDESLRMKWISLHHMQALLPADDVYGVYEVHCFSMVTEGITTSSEVTESEDGKSACATSNKLLVGELIVLYNSLVPCSSVCDVPGRFFEIYSDHRIDVGVDRALNSMRSRDHNHMLLLKLSKSIVQHQDS
ncbi:ty3-gypsy retrotransposon protein [Tanacetum coccineum]